LGSLTFKWLAGGVFITPTIIAVRQKADCSIVGQTGQFIAYQTCLVPWPRQPTIEVCSSRPLDPIIVQTVWCTPDIPVHTGQSGDIAPRVPGCGPLCSDCPVTHGIVEYVLFTIRCTTRVLADCPLGFFRCFLRFLLFLSLGLLRIFLVLLLRCCILRTSVQSSSHPVNYKHKY
jgi:hypothetical protein